MSVEPTGRPPGDGNDQPTPFKGTPFEQLFAAFGGGGTPGTGGIGFTGVPGMPAGSSGMPDFAALMAQVQAMMQPHEGAVNWSVAKDVARRTVAENPDASVSAAQLEVIADALRLADHWL